MKKNNKGFTLVELLAAIVILGILSVLALPMITGMVENSRNKMYISDARKLISQAEYLLKANSSTIDKPDPGDCIIISMHYLDNSVFSSAPNGGEYVIDHSYVVVRNNDGKLEYSACLIEKLKKGGYKGVVLTRESDLIKKRANTQYVQSFRDSDLVDVENDINEIYINSYLGSDYISGEVSNVYHYHELEDNNIQIVKNSTPIIESASMSGDGELIASISLKVNDEDTSRKDLKVYISIDKDFPVVEVTPGKSEIDFSNLTPISYGDAVSFSQAIDFSKYSYSYAQGGKVTINVAVRDPASNYAEKKLYYDIKKNVAPSITGATLSAKEGDSVNLLTATLSVSGTDDLDEFTKLSFCIKESSKNGATDCSDYKDYNSFFTTKKSNGGSLDYTFKECSGGCKRDGSTQYLTLFVKDTMNAVSTQVVSYIFSSNKKPTLTTEGVMLSTGPASFNGNSKNVKVTITTTDDLDDASKLKVTISDGVNSKEYPYSSINNVFDFTVDGDYYGDVASRTKNISVFVTDSENAISDIVTKPYVLYENQAPQIGSFAVNSDGLACNNGKYCPVIVGDNVLDGNQETIDSSGITKNGSLNTILSFSILDDIEVDNNYGNIKVCISQVKSDCNNDNNFKPYSEYTRLEKITYTLSGSYTGTEAERTKTIYLKIKDSYGLSDEAETKYVLYEDQAPQFDENGFVVESKAASFVTKTVGDISSYIKIIADDDFDTDNLVFTLKHNNVEVIKNQLISSLYTLRDSGEVDKDNNPIYNRIYDYLYSVSDKYDGSTHEFEAYVTDKSGNNSVSKKFTYKVYKNVAPKKGTAAVYKANNKDGRNLLDVYFDSGITDDIDSAMIIQYCYKIGTSTEAHCMDPMLSSGMAHLTRSNLFSDFQAEYKGQQLKLYAVATDSGGESVTGKTATYTLYNAPAPVISGDIIAVYDPDAASSEPDTQEGSDSEVDENVVNVTFQVTDTSYYGYSICINNTNSCTDYLDGYEGGEVYTIPYNYPTEITATSKVYLFVKNANKAGTTKNVTVKTSIVDTSCKYTSEVTKYFYTPKNNKKISSANCSNKCYHENKLIGDTNAYTATYSTSTTISYYDKLNGDTLCSSKNGSVKDEKKYCDFKDCFYDETNNSYNQIVLGTFIFYDNPWTIEYKGVTYVVDSYYKLYSSSYNEGDKGITLTEMGQHICPNCYQNGFYKDPAFSSLLLDENTIRVADLEGVVDPEADAG